MHAARAGGERGTVTLFVLGICVGLLFLGGLSLDLWRAVAVRRELSAMADAAAAAAANGLDEDALRAGIVRLDPPRARAYALQTLLQYPRADSLDAGSIDVGADRATVVLGDHVDFSLLSIFLGGDRFDVAVTAVAEPQERA
jgi:Flp pilus assembly protein TadG